MSHYRSECGNCGEYASLNDDGRCGPDVNDCAQQAKDVAAWNACVESLAASGEGFAIGRIQ